MMEPDCRKCKMCSATENLHIDHIEPHAVGGEFWDEENMQVLCESCHKVKSLRDVRSIISKKKAYRSIPIDVFLEGL